MYNHLTPLGLILIALALHPTIGQAECRPKAWVLFDEIQTLQSVNWQISFNAAIITTEAELDSLTPQDHQELRKALRGLVEESGFLVLHLHSSDWYKKRIVDTLNEALRDKDPVYDILLFDLSGTETLSLSALAVHHPSSFTTATNRFSTSGWTTRTESGRSSSAGADLRLQLHHQPLRCTRSTAGTRMV